ncbi:glucose-6-phosphate dehydrogenase [Buchnera aphidicola (Ceratovacuna keduensis)]|uniref:glucose-6-phosphate dehydrogenase n=1 Tax=Buchnera aphidicola TaxID=9 RepID=UPI0031B820DE
MNCNNYDFVIFGTKGDLSQRKLFPALYKLDNKKILDKKTKIIGVGRAKWKKNNFLKFVKKSLKKFLIEKINKNTWKIFKKRLIFCNLDVYNTKNFYKLKKKLKNNKIIINYFAIPSNSYEKICKGLYKFNLNLENSRIVLEKPIGDSLITSKKINKKIGKYFKESQIFRIDHYLGKDTIINLLYLRFTNSIFYNNWNNKSIDHVQITVAEKIGIEGRNKYFNKTGQTKDMVQNHILQILSIITMKEPKKIDSKNIRNEKIKILKKLNFIKKHEIHKKTSIGQYSYGEIDNIKLTSYNSEILGKKNSNTETFVAIKIEIKNKMWKGVPFYVRTGKRLPKKCSKIVIVFKNTTPKVFNKFSNSINNKLIIYLEPNESIYFKFLNKIPSLKKKCKLKSSKMYFKYSKNFEKKNIPDSYEKLLLSCILGDQSLFVHIDEVKYSWKWIDNIINIWKKVSKKIELYSSGTWGPNSSKKIIEKDGRKWI